MKRRNDADLVLKTAELKNLELAWNQVIRTAQNTAKLDLNARP